MDQKAKTVQLFLQDKSNHNNQPNKKNLKKHFLH